MMSLRTLLSRLAAAALALSALTTNLAAAQNQPRLHVNNVLEQEPVPGAAGLSALALTVNFTILDGPSEVQTEAKPEEVTVDIGTGGVFPATVQKLETPWSVVLLVDTSRTLTGFTASAAHKDARSALAAALDDAPSDTNFAILTFGTQAATVVDFTRDNDTLQNTLLTRLRPLSDQSPCLNDGVFEAVNKLSGASGRRAVLIFTASADGCGQRPAQDVVNLAQRNHIEIYGVGLRGYSITEGELNALAEPTGGLATLREQDNLTFGFQNVMSLLDNQWQAKTTLYPPAGPQTATLNVRLEDGTVLTSEPVNFEADQNYAQPPSINLRGTVQSTSTGLRFNLDIVSADLIDHLEVDVVSKATGNAVLTQTLTTGVRETNEVPIDGLTEGQEFTLVVRALDRTDGLLSETSADFTFNPPAPVLTVTRVDLPTEEQPAVQVVVDSVNLEKAVKYKAWLQLADQQAGGPVPIESTVQTVPVGDPLLLPVADLATGSYQAVVQALDTNNTPLAQASSERFQYESPSAFEAFVRRVGETRLAIAATTLICLAVMAVAGVGGGILLLRRSARPKEVMMVLPERKLSAAAAPMPEPVYERDSNLDRPTRPPPAAPGESSMGERQPAPPPQAPPKPVTVPPNCLSNVEPAEPKFAVTVNRSPFTLGRRGGNDLVVPVGNKSGMSGRHATITFAGGRFYVQDDYSSFGTRLNNERLQPGIPSPLEDGAIIELGPSVKIKFALKACEE